MLKWWEWHGDEATLTYIVQNMHKIQLKSVSRIILWKETQEFHQLS